MGSRSKPSLALPVKAEGVKTWQGSMEERVTELEFNLEERLGALEDFAEQIQDEDEEDEPQEVTALARIKALSSMATVMADDAFAVIRIKTRMQELALECCACVKPMGTLASDTAAPVEPA